MSARGITVATAKIYVRLVDVFFGSTDSPKVQRESVAPAEERGLSIEYLEIVNKHAKKLKTRSAAWKLHAELIAFAGTPEEVDAYCNKRVTDEGSDKPKQKGVPVGRAIGAYEPSALPILNRKSPTSRKHSAQPSRVNTNLAPKRYWSLSRTLSKATVPVKKSSLHSPTAPR